MQKPRNPRYFPKMKVRGARRKRLAPFQRMTRQFELLNEAPAQVVNELKKMAGIL